MDFTDLGAAEFILGEEDYNEEYDEYQLLEEYEDDIEPELTEIINTRQ